MLPEHLRTGKDRTTTASPTNRGMSSRKRTSTLHHKNQLDQP